MMPSISIKCGMVWMVGVLAVTAIGCGGTYDATVSGAVTLDGNQLSRGTVAYHPVSGGPAAYARIGGDGSYSVQTGREEGLPSGEYEVTVVANEPPVEKQSNLGGPPAPGKPITPPWYRTKQSSGLRFTVEAGDNDINLELKSQPPAGWNTARRP